VTFAIWKKEHPQTRVLKPAQEFKDDYASADWEKEIADDPTVTPVDAGDPLQPRDLVVGIAAGGAATAYPFDKIAAANPIVDDVGGTPILLLLHSDGRSLRCFDRRLDGDTLELFLEPGSAPPMLLDGRTDSRWDFSGLAVSGPLAGRRLAHLACLKDFWFDWKGYHPKTRVFTNEEAASD
jgi:hypothetical protein